VEVRIAERTRQLAEANRRLRQKVEHLQASQATRIQMYRMLGHELRGPLTTMCSLVDVLVATLNGEEQKDAEVIRNQIDTLLVLVEDLLELARARDGSLSRSAERLDLAVLVQEEVEAQREAVAEDVKFHLRLAPAPVEADRRDVERIITNLVGNAVKYTRRGVIAVTTGVEDGHTRFGVVDTGPGIPQDKLGSIFEPFAQVNGVDPREGFGSSGLGLAITKALVERAGGAISVKSQVGEGSAFRVRLPVADTLEVEK
jgi:signal transduction histidine kinase